MNLLSYIRILPLVILVALLSFGVRVGEFVAGVRSGAAVAQEKVAAEPPASPLTPPVEQTAKAPEPAAPAPVATPPASLPDHPAEGEATSLQWRDAGDEDFSDSTIQEDLYRDLAARRKDLQKRERDLTTREALLKATERELDEKIREMTQLRGEIEAMMTTLSEEEEKRLVSLVKIYEGMKAKEAARIFNTLDLDVLLEVLSRMSERRSAPIIAQMEVERARTVTILLAEQKNMPVLPSQ